MSMDNFRKQYDDEIYRLNSQIFNLETALKKISQHNPHTSYCGTCSHFAELAKQALCHKDSSPVIEGFLTAKSEPQNPPSIEIRDDFCEVYKQQLYFWAIYMLVNFSLVGLLYWLGYSPITILMVLLIHWHCGQKAEKMVK